MAVALALTNLFCGPAFAQALSGRWKAAIAWFVALIAGVIATALSVWGIALLFAITLGSVVDAALGIRRMSVPHRWSGILAGGAVLASYSLAIIMTMVIIEPFKFPSSSMMPTFAIGDHIYADKLSAKLGTPKPGDVIVFAMPCQPQHDYIKRVIAVAGDTIEVRCDKLYVNSKLVADALVDPATSYEDYDEGGGQWFPRDVSRYRQTIGDHTFETFYARDRPERDAARAKGAPADESRHDFPSEVLRTCAAQEFGMEQHSQPANQLPGSLVETNPRPDDPCKPHRHFVVPEDSLFVMGDNRDNSNDSRYWGVVPAANVRGFVRGVWWPVSHFGSRD